MQPSELSDSEASGHALLPEPAAKRAQGKHEPDYHYQDDRLPDG